MNAEEMADLQPRAAHPRELRHEARQIRLSVIISEDAGPAELAIDVIEGRRGSEAAP